MKFLPSQFAYLISEPEARRNLRALAQVAPVLAGSIGAFTVLFHLIMTYEGQDHSWLTGLDWTLTVMSNLGFGEITFASDLGRGFTIIVPVAILEADPGLRARLRKIADRVVIGDVANFETVLAAGIEETRSVVLTTNDDATNLFLAIHCRKLSATAHIISRIDHDWNLEAIHRAGADFALSHGSLEVQTLVAMVRGRDLIVLREGTELFVERTPPRLHGKSLAESGIGATTGLNVVAIREGGGSSRIRRRTGGWPRDRSS